MNKFCRSVAKFSSTTELWSWQRCNYLFHHQKRYSQHQTVHMLNELTKGHTIEETRSALHNFIQHIERHPYEKHVAITDGAIPLLQKYANNHDDQYMKDYSKLALALLGYNKPLKSRGIRILSIDGGGVRGIIVMELLKRLEILTGKRVFDLFDLVCGVSTGAILICALAANSKMTLNEAISLYRTISNQMFNKPGTLDVLSATSRLVWSHAYYDIDLWESLLKQHVGYKRIIETSKNVECPKICCISTTVSEDNIEAHVFRNYCFPYNVQSIYTGSHSARMWEVVRASSAAPAYFGDFILNHQIHQDGGILFNNPTTVAIHEAKLLWPNEKIQCVVSFGTGRPPNKANKHNGQKIYNANMINEEYVTSSWKTKFLRILDSATDTEAAHTALSDLLSPGSYFRFNPYLTEWLSMVEVRTEKLVQLEKDTLNYYNSNEDKFEQVAKLLTQEKNFIQKIGSDIMNKISL